MSYSLIVMTRDAFQKITPAQQRAIIRLTEGDTVEKLEVTSSNPFDLPPGYVAFRLDYSAFKTDNQRSIYGGISETGDVST